MAKVKVKIVSCMTVGPPTVGKTTLREQLSNQSNNQPTQHARPLSTRVMDRTKILRSTVNHNTWEHITSDEEFTAYMKGCGSDALYHKFSYVLIIYLCISIIPTWIAFLFLGLIHKATGYKSICFLEHGITVTIIILPVLYYIYYKSYRAAVNSSKNKTTRRAKQALRNKKTKKVLPFNEYTLIIHFRDSGGQPEFHEVVPALVPHSTLYLLMFNLNEDLNTQYNVTYKASEDDTTDPYQSSFTVKQTLLQLLASIQSLNHSSQGITSNAFIIGTHKDQLVNEETRINQIQQELEEEIKGTDWYTSDTIITTPDGHLMLPINTYSQDDVEKVKEMISQSIATRRCTISMPVLALYFSIEKLGKSVMTFREFKRLAQDCNIHNQEKFNQVLWPLRDVLGSIQYFDNISKLNDIVITDPQILFDLVSELIVCTFNFKNLRTMSDRHQTERFRSSSRFKKESLKRCEVVKKGLLTEDQVISILQHLNIIAPVGINDEGEKEYFLPCVLVHAPVSTQPTSTNTTGYSPLLITFECGYIPRGVFSCLISSILCSSQGQWVLASEEIHRNQIKFHLTNYGHYVLIKNHTKYLEVSVTVCHGSNVSDVPFSDIQMFLSKHLTAVLHQLNYSPSKAGHSFGFYCSLEQHSGHNLHIAQCMSNARNRHIKCTIDSSLEPSCLTPEQAVWFKGKRKCTPDISMPFFLMCIRVDDSQASSRNTFGK